MASIFHMDGYYTESLDPTDLPAASSFLCPPFLWPFFPPFALSQDLPGLSDIFDIEGTLDLIGSPKPQEPTSNPPDSPKDTPKPKPKRTARKSAKGRRRKKAKTVGTLTAIERRARIVRFLEKRERRRFSKQVKYQCRKRAADRRLRVRGRFASTPQPDSEPQVSEYL